MNYPFRYIWTIADTSVHVHLETCPFPGTRADELIDSMSPSIRSACTLINPHKSATR